MAKEPKTKKAGEEKKTSKKKRTVKPVARVSSKRQASKKTASKKKGTKTASKAAGKKIAGKINAAPSKKTKKTGKAKKASLKTPARKTKQTPPKKQNRKAKKVSRPGKVSKPSARKKQAIAAKKKATRRGRKAPRHYRPGTKNAPLVISGPKRDNAPLALTNNIAEALEREITNPDWQAVAHFNSTPGRPFTLFTCDMIVPQKPADHIGQTIIIFIGLQSFTENRIVQPILQWGRSQMNGGGRHWSVGSCLAKGQFVLEEKSDLFEVEPGTHLRAVIEGKATGGNFRYSCFFEGMEQETRIETDRIPELKNCCVTLEAARIESRNNYPAEPLIAISDIELKSGSQFIQPDWRLEGFSQHGEQATVNQDEIELRF